MSAGIDLLRCGALRAVARSRPLLFVLRLPVLILFVGLMLAALLGSESRNIATAGTGVLWLVAVSVVTPVVGKFWCVVCPWDAVAEWIQRLGLWRKNDDPLTAGFTWPAGLANAYPALGLFVALVWAEYAFDVTDSPRFVGYFCAGIVSAAVVVGLLFKRKTFCRYVCPIGATSGLYSVFSIFEIRARDRERCRTCRSKDCVRGNEMGYGCPVYEYPGTMESNVNCILCTECIKTCPYENVGLNLRFPGTELLCGTKDASRHVLGRRNDLSLLAGAMLALSYTHGLSLTPVFGRSVVLVANFVGVGTVLAFSVLLILFLAAVWGVCCGVRLAVRTADGPASRRVDHVVLVLALTVHLIFTVQHAFARGELLIPLLSDPIGSGWDLFGTARMTHFVPMEPASMFALQVGLAVVGWVAVLVLLLRRGASQAVGPGRRVAALLLVISFATTTLSVALWMAVSYVNAAVSRLI
ncbi:MAG: 4Fe-4S binding protein [Planctomycetota bacterium]|nr:4Fe-4S binding protein [Planctomycetota bacterium]